MARSRPDTASFVSGVKFGPYRLVRRLGKGGMAEVFLAYEEVGPETERQVVLKRLLPEIAQSRDFLVMFSDEARLATRLEHPNIAKTYKFGDVSGLPFLALEHVDGVTSSDLLLSLRPEVLPAEMALWIVADVLAGLHHAHELRDDSGALLGVVHRDVSPQNVMVSRSGVAKLIDFGVARAATQIHVTGKRRLKGKLAYIAPEILKRASPDRRADVFAAGIVLHELIFGDQLFKRSSEAETVKAIRDEDAPSLVPFGAPPDLDAVVKKALAKDPDERYATALEMREAIEPFLDTEEEARIREELGALVDETVVKIENEELSDPEVDKDTVMDSFGGPPDDSGSRGLPAPEPRARILSWKQVGILLALLLGAFAVSSVFSLLFLR